MDVCTDLNLDFAQAVEPFALLRALCTAHWTLNDFGAVNYWLQEDGDAQRHHFETEAEALGHIEAVFREHPTLSLTLTSREDEHRLSFNFSRQAPQRLSLWPPESRAISRHQPAMIDLTWYLGRLLPALESCGLQIVALNATADA